MKKLLVILTIIMCLPFIFKAIPITYTYNLYNDLREITITDEIHFFILEHVADANDTYKVNISSHGGYVYKFLPILNHLRNTEATVHTHNYGSAQSAAALIFTAGDVQTAEPYSSLLFHKARYYNYDNEVVISPEPVVDIYVEEFILPHFTLEERTRYNNGEDIEMFTDTWAVKQNLTAIRSVK